MRGSGETPQTTSAPSADYYGRFTYNEYIPWKEGPSCKVHYTPANKCMGTPSTACTYSCHIKSLASMPDELFILVLIMIHGCKGTAPQILLFHGSLCPDSLSTDPWIPMDLHAWVHTISGLFIHGLVESPWISMHRSGLFPDYPPQEC